MTETSKTSKPLTIWRGGVQPKRESAKLGFSQGPQRRPASILLDSVCVSSDRMEYILNGKHQPLAAAYLSVNPETLRRLARRRQIPFLRIGTRHLHFRRDVLDQWVRSRDVRHSRAQVRPW